MRLCRFLLDDDLILSGFFADDHLVPIDQAAEAFADQTGQELTIATTHDLLDLLPGGESFSEVRTLSEWIDGLDGPARQALALGVGSSEGSVRLLTPIERPGKLLLLAGNYAEHVAEGGGTTAERQETFPYVFPKPFTTLTHPGNPIVLPSNSPDHVDWECELGVVIGQTCRRVDESAALDYVAGYTVVNDISDRKFRPNPGRKPRERDVFFDWLHGKWHDTFCPMGPCILSADAVPNPQAFRLRLEVNGEVKQDGTTADMVFPVASVVAFLSQLVTLEPGDVISTGTPAGVGRTKGTYLKAGDIVVATIDGIGRLENPVESEA